MILFVKFHALIITILLYFYYYFFISFVHVIILPIYVLYYLFILILMHFLSVNSHSCMLLIHVFFHDNANAHIFCSYILVFLHY